MTPAAISGRGCNLNIYRNNAQVATSCGVLINLGRVTFRWGARQTKLHAHTCSIWTDNPNWKVLTLWDSVKRHSFTLLVVLPTRTTHSPTGYPHAQGESRTRVSIHLYSKDANSAGLATVAISNAQFVTNHKLDVLHCDCVSSGQLDHRWTLCNAWGEGFENFRFLEWIHSHFNIKVASVRLPLGEKKENVQNFDKNRLVEEEKNKMENK